jgi:hypothetical protein
MRQLRSRYKTVWYEVRDEEGRAIRRFESMEDAESFAQDHETIEKITLTREAYVPEEAPF